MSSKFHIFCSCTHCHKTLTAQSLKLHFQKCTAEPKYTCIQCGTATNNNKFCSRSCRAKYVNPRRPSRAKYKRTQDEFFAERADVEAIRFSRGEITERSSLRKHLARTKGYKCNKCGIHNWNNETLTLIVDHIDGNAGNNLPSNLQLMCPNCNSQSPTFGGRNKGNGRKSRGLPTR